MSSRHPVLSTTLIGATFLLLSGCAGTLPGALSTAAPSSTPEAAASAEEVALSGPECLVGDWYIENDQMQAFYDALAANVAGGSGITFDITGGTGLSFADTTYVYTPEFTLGLVVSGITGSGTITGAVSGDYSATDDSITTAFNTSDVALTISVGGVVQDGAGLFGDILSSDPINDAPYECSPAGPIIGFDTGGDRFNVQLTPRT
ncbi:MAG: hypothetical protein ACOH1J_07705 [Microbacteriaceae bacterium]